MPRSKPHPTRLSTRLAFETLEDRTVPSHFGGEHVSRDPHDWPMFGHDVTGSRYNDAEHRLSTRNVSDLQELWRFQTDGAVAGTTVVVNNVIYAADSAGSIYAVRANGTLKWKTTLDIPSIVGVKIASSPLVTNRTVMIGDSTGVIHGLDVNTGAVRWSTNPNPHPFAAIFGHGTMVGNYVAYGTSSFELLVPALDPSYTNFTFRGSVVLIDPADGRIVWQTYTISDAEHAQGASGATVWSAPAYDKASNTIFVGTSNNYSSPTTTTSDALMALDATTGAIKWVSQKTGGDNWNFSYLPEDPSDPPDFDFGDAPQIYKIKGRTVVAAGQKSGFFHVVDAATGEELVPPRQFLAGDHLGGFHIDSGYARGVNYAPGNKWFDPFSGGQPESGHLFAINKDGSDLLWQADFDAPVIAGVAIANNVVYVQSIDGTFYALHAKTGAELLRLDTGGQSGGPAISRGRVYLGTGDVLTTAVQNPFFVPGPGAIVALGLPDRNGHDKPGKDEGKARPISARGSGSFTDEEGGFFATGVASHLGAFKHYGTLLLAPTDDPAVFSISGTSVYEAANGDELHASLSGTLNVATGVATGTDTWIGGTGRFADAIGTANLHAQLLEGGSFEFDFSGFIDF
jgi:polyvinyl alcohol dehydrogenase (cytochrome)